MRVNKEGMPVCHLCNKAFKDKRGLAGHLWSKHGIKATQCEEFIDGPQEVLILEDALRNLFDLNEDLKEYDIRLKRAEESVSGSFFGLGFLPIKTEQDKELIELLKFLIKAKEEEGKRMVEDLLRLKEVAFERTTNYGTNGKADTKKVGFLEVMKHNKELANHKLMVAKEEKVQRLQNVVEANGSEEDLREAIK